jgi:hypothetical protein
MSIVSFLSLAIVVVVAAAAAPAPAAMEVSHADPQSDPPGCLMGVLLAFLMCLADGARRRLRSIKSTAAAYLDAVLSLLGALGVLALIGYASYRGVVDARRANRWSCHRILDLDQHDTGFRQLQLQNAAANLNTFYLRDSDTDRDLYRFRYSFEDSNFRIYDLVAASETDIGQLEWSQDLSHDPRTHLAMNCWPYLGIWSPSAIIDVPNLRAGLTEWRDDGFTSLEQSSHPLIRLPIGVVAAQSSYRTGAFKICRVRNESATLENNQRADFVLAMLALNFAGPP